MKQLWVQYLPEDTLAFKLEKLGIKPPTFQLVDDLHYSQFYFWVGSVDSVGSVGSAACLFWPTFTPDAAKGFS